MLNVDCKTYNSNNSKHAHSQKEIEYRKMVCWIKCEKKTEKKNFKQKKYF